MVGAGLQGSVQTLTPGHGYTVLFKDDCSGQPQPKGLEDSGSHLAFVDNWLTLDASLPFLAAIGLFVKGGYDSGPARVLMTS